MAIELVAIGLILLVAALPMILLIVGIWRIGTGLLQIAMELRGADGSKSLAESAELQAEALASYLSQTKSAP